MRYNKFYGFISFGVHILETNQKINNNKIIVIFTHIHELALSHGAIVHGWSAGAITRSPTRTWGYVRVVYVQTNQNHMFTQSISCDACYCIKLIKISFEMFFMHISLDIV